MGSNDVRKYISSSQPMTTPLYLSCIVEFEALWLAFVFRFECNCLVCISAIQMMHLPMQPFYFLVHTHKHTVIAIDMYIDSNFMPRMFSYDLANVCVNTRFDSSAISQVNEISSSLSALFLQRLGWRCCIVIRRRIVVLVVVMQRHKHIEKQKEITSMLVLVVWWLYGPFALPR